jgi:hypothetical protein
MTYQNGLSAYRSAQNLWSEAVCGLPASTLWRQSAFTLPAIQNHVPISTSSLALANAKYSAVSAAPSLPKPLQAGRGPPSGR